MHRLKILPLRANMPTLTTPFITTRKIKRKSLITGPKEPSKSSAILHLPTTQVPIPSPIEPEKRTNRQWSLYTWSEISTTAATVLALRITSSNPRRKTTLWPLRSQRKKTSSTTKSVSRAACPRPPKVTRLPTRKGDARDSKEARLETAVLSNPT